MDDGVKSRWYEFHVVASNIHNNQNMCNQTMCNLNKKNYLPKRKLVNTYSGTTPFGPNHKQSTSKRRKSGHTSLLECFRMQCTCRHVERREHFSRHGLPVKAAAAVVVFSLSGESLRLRCKKLFGNILHRNKQTANHQVVTSRDEFVPDEGIGTLKSLWSSIQMACQSSVLENSQWS